MKTRVKLGTVVFLLASAFPSGLSAQVEGTLEPGRSFERELATGDRHTFELILNANDFVYGEADQKTVDVVVNVFGPDGESLGTFDQPARGPEPFQFTSDVGGTYRIEVTPFREEEGRYVLQILRSEPVASKPEGRVDQLMASNDGDDRPGAAVLVVQNGKVVLRKGYGQANLEHGIPITPTTVFDIASLAKQFTGMAIAMLVENTTLDLDDDIRTYLPEIPDFGNTITVRHLVHHTSGIRDWPGTLQVAGLRMNDVISFEQILTMARNQRDLNFIPGAEYQYSNTGYNILARLVEQVSGQSFREWTDANIFQPLGMANTHFHDDLAEVVPNRAQGYIQTQGGYGPFNNGLTALGSSSLFTTVDDLAKWTMNFQGGQVGGMAVIERMEQQGVLNDGTQISYAFGQGRGDYHGLTRWSHTGGWAGFSTVIHRIPERQFSVIILGNIAINPGVRATQITDIYLSDDLVATLEEESDASGRPSESDRLTFHQGGDRDAQRIETWAPSEEELNSYAGRYYSLELETTYTLRVQDSTLIAEHQRHDDITLSPSAGVARGSFQGNRRFFRSITFSRDEMGNVIEMLVSAGGRVRNLVFVKED